MGNNVERQKTEQVDSKNEQTKTAKVNAFEAKPDSLTAILNDVVEKHAITAGGIRNLEKGDFIMVYLLDRNIGDYLHGTKAGTQLDTRGYLDDSHLCMYVHDHELTGTLYMINVSLVHKNWTWEINTAKWSERWYWNDPISADGFSSIECNIPQEFRENHSLVPNETKVGWRGPAILMDQIHSMPKTFTHYNTAVDDYFPKRHRDLSTFETTNNLTTREKKYVVRYGDTITYTVYIRRNHVRVKSEGETIIDDDFEKIYTDVQKNITPPTSTFLLHHAENSYIFVGNCVYNFEIGTPVQRFNSPVNSFNIPVPYVITKEGIYRLDDKRFMRIADREREIIEYEEFAKSDTEPINYSILHGETHFDKSKYGDKSRILSSSV